jgi:PRTRC genetic system protein E
MFKELEPALKLVTVLMSVSADETGAVSVTVIPKPAGNVKDDALKGLLSTPFAMSGTGEEIDLELPAWLEKFAQGGLKLSGVAADVKKQIDALDKAIKDAESAKKKAVGDKKVEAAKKGIVPPKPKPETAGLFEAPADEPEPDDSEGEGDDE